MPAKLSVNLNAIAMLRNRRDLPWPSVTGLGAIALEAGAQGLTVHPRPDQRHIRFSDVPEIRALLDDRFPQAEFNIEGIYVPFFTPTRIPPPGKRFSPALQAFSIPVGAASITPRLAHPAIAPPLQAFS